MRVLLQYKFSKISYKNNTPFFTLTVDGGELLDLNYVITLQLPLYAIHLSFTLF